MVDHNTLTHKFISTKAQNPDASITSRNEWNSEHTFGGGTNGQVLAYDNTQTDHVKWVSAATPVNIVVKGFILTGTGTKNDPWLGWESAFSAISGGTYYDATPYTSYEFSAGWYSTPYTMRLTKYVTISGQGEATVIKYTGTNVGIRIEATESTVELYAVYRISLYNFQLVSVTGAIGISITNTYDINLHQVDIIGALDIQETGGGWVFAGIFIGAVGSGLSAFLIRLNQCRIQRCTGHGVLVGNYPLFVSTLVNPYVSSLITTISFVGCRIQGNSLYGFYTAMYMACLTFESTDVEGNTLGDIWADIVNGISIINSYFENTTVPNIAIGSGTGGNGGGVFINGCYFNHHLGGNAIAIGASGNEVRGVAITGNYFIAQNASAAAIKLGKIVMGQFCPNYLPSGKIMFDLTTADLVGCEVQDITATDPFVKTFITTAVAQVLAIKNYSNSAGVTSQLHFKDQLRTRAIIGSRSSNTASNAGALDLQVGIGGDAFRAALTLDDNTTAGETAMLLWDVTAGSLKRVTVDGSRFLKLAT